MTQRRAAWLLVATLTVAPSYAQDPDASGVEDGFERIVADAEKARAEKRLEDAAALYREAVGLRKDWVDGHWALATLLYDLDRCEEASVHFGAVLTYREADGLALALKGLCEVRLGNYGRALSELHRASALGIPDRQVMSAALLQMALLVNRSGDHDAARQVLEPFTILGDDRPPVILAFGLAMLRLPVLIEEATVEQREMAMLAGRAAYNIQRGERKQVDRLALEELVSRYPTASGAHYAFAMYLEDDEPEAAIAEFRRELEVSPDHHPAMLELATLHLRVAGDVEAARALCERAKRVAPDSPAVYLVSGQVLLEAGDAGAAVAELEHGSRLAPESALFHYWLANAYRREGRREAAARARAAFERLSSAESSGSPTTRRAGDGGGG